MTDRLSELLTDAVEAFPAQSAGNVVMPPRYDRLPVVERRSWA